MSTKLRTSADVHQRPVIRITWRAQGWFRESQPYPLIPEIVVLIIRFVMTRHGERQRQWQTDRQTETFAAGRLFRCRLRGHSGRQTTRLASSRIGISRRRSSCEYCTWRCRHAARPSSSSSSWWSSSSCVLIKWKSAPRFLLTVGAIRSRALNPIGSSINSTVLCTRMQFVPLMGAYKLRSLSEWSTGSYYTCE